VTKIPKDYPIQPLTTVRARNKARSLTQCGTCLLYWDDAVSTSMTPAPSARCPFEYFHDVEKEGAGNS
jgi:hypothetical protein